MGRVNTRNRMLRAKAMGVDSADGTYLTRGPDKNLPNLLRWLCEPIGKRAVQREPVEKPAQGELFALAGGEGGS